MYLCLLWCYYIFYLKSFNLDIIIMCTHWKKIGVETIFAYSQIASKFNNSSCQETLLNKHDILK